MLAISAEGVSKRYKGLSQTALSNVSISAESGQIYTLLGRNGAGKTTFVRICATQLMPTTGRIQVLGYDVLKEADKVRKTYLYSSTRRQATKSSYSLGPRV